MVMISEAFESNRQSMSLSDVRGNGVRKAGVKVSPPREDFKASKPPEPSSFRRSLGFLVEVSKSARQKSKSG